jgi:hypothetical protein
VRPERLAEVQRATRAASAVADYRELLGNRKSKRSMSAPRPRRPFPDRARLPGGRQARVPRKTDRHAARRGRRADCGGAQGRLKFTIGYSQRFNPKFAYVRKALRDGTIGRPVSALVSRHITRGLGEKISGRVRLSPAAMEATHDLDFILWCLEPAKPVRVYSQGELRRDAGKGGGGAQIPTRSGSP